MLVVIIDALDECDGGDGRRSLLSFLRGWSKLVPWIKVIVTSRPDQDIKNLLGKPKDSAVWARNVHNYNASGDIYAYIRKQMTDVATARNRVDWPDDSVKLLSQRANGLFIWAATACRFISEAVNVDQRFKQVLEGTESSGSSYRLDVLYTTAIRHSMESEDPDNVEYTRQCIATVVATASRTPLSVAALEALLRNRFGDGTLRYIVGRLGSVLYEDKKRGNVVRVYHPSFADYVTNPDRSKEMHVTTESINTTLAECCLSSMLRELRFNICGLETSRLLNYEIPDLENRVRSAIGSHLKYSCVHWSSHLSLATKGALDAQIGDFLLGPVLLFWIEALSLYSGLSVALSSLQEAKDKISGTEESYVACAHDAYRFVLSFYDAISESTPHLYVSALPLAPKKSLIAQRMWPLFPNVFKVAEGADEHWSACLRTISLDDSACSTAISPDGRLIATSSHDAVELWDAETGEPVSDPLDCSDGELAFSHDGGRLFCHRYSGGIQVWGIDTLKPVPMTLPTTSEETWAIALSCNDRLAVTSPKDHAITVWDLSLGTVVCTLVGHSSDAESISFSPNGRLIASASYDRTMRIWDADSGAALFDQSNEAISVAFSPDSRYVVCGCWDKVQIWDTLTYTPMMEVRAPDASFACSIAYSPSGRSVAVGFHDSVRIWNLDTASAPPILLLGHTDTVQSVMFSPNGQHIISGSKDGTVRIWDVDNHTTALPLRAGHSACVNQILFSLDDRHVYSASEDNTVGTWDVVTGDAACVPLVGPIESLYPLISPNCQHVATHDKKELLYIWDISTRTSTALSGIINGNSALSFSSDGLRLASANEEADILRVHDIETGAELLASKATGQGHIYYVEYSPCDRFIVTGHGDENNRYTVCIWSAEMGTAVGGPLEGEDVKAYALAFSSNGRLIASGSEHSIRVYEVETGNLVRKILDLNNPTTALAFSPNGRRMVTGSIDNVISIWDMDSDDLTPELLFGHTGVVTSVAFSHDGSRIASSSEDCTIRIWDAVNTNTAIENSLNDLTSALYPATSSSSDPAGNISQVVAKSSEPSNLTVSTSHLVHREGGGWVFLTEDSALLWLLPDYRAVDDSIVQVSARHLPRHSIDFSKFVHSDRWMSRCG